VELESLVLSNSLLGLKAAKLIMQVVLIGISIHLMQADFRGALGLVPDDYN
jgi:hypothetical protein